MGRLWKNSSPFEATKRLMIHMNYRGPEALKIKAYPPNRWFWVRLLRDEVYPGTLLNILVYRFKNQPSLSITAFVALLPRPSPLATKTPTFSLTVSAISATFLCVNHGQSRADWITSSLTSFSHTLTAYCWSLTTTAKSLYLAVLITHLCFSGSASGACARKATLNPILNISYCCCLCG